MKRKLVKPLERAFGLAMLLGLFNFSYDEARQKFRERRLLSIYGRCCRWMVCVLVLSVVWAYYVIMIRFWSWENTARIQDRIMWYINIVQLYLGVFITYTSHSCKQSHLLQMLNCVVKCKRKLVRLLGKDVRPVRKFYIIRNIRIVAVILDIYFTWNRPPVFTLITHEFKRLAVFNKVVITSSFLGQHYIQSFIASSFRRMECFVDKRNGMLSAEECRLFSEISSQLHKIRLSSNAYHGLFGFISYFSLIRAICFFYSCFSAFFTSGLLRTDVFSIIINYFGWMILPGLVPIVDIILLGVAADAITTNGKGFHWKVYMVKSKSATSTEAHQLIETILLKEHVENMQTVITSGVVMDRSFSIETVFEVLSWVIVAFVYCGGRFNSASLALIAVNLKIKNTLYLLIVSICLTCGLWFCIHSVLVCVKNARRRIKNVFCRGDSE